MRFIHTHSQAHVSPKIGDTKTFITTYTSNFNNDLRDLHEECIDFRYYFEYYKILPMCNFEMSFPLKIGTSNLKVLRDI